MKKTLGMLMSVLLVLVCIGASAQDYVSVVGSSAISFMRPLRLPWQGSHCLQLGYIPEHSKSPSGNPEQLH